MRRREKFVISSILLSLGLAGVQYVALDYRYWAVAVFTVISYLFSAWALSDDLQKHEWLTVIPLPALYASAVSLFYFLLPSNGMTRITLLVFFGIGMYALYLTSNIFSVAKGRTIQLLHAAHAIGLLFSLLISMLFLNTIFSLKLIFWLNGLLVGLSHFPLIFLSLWSVKLEPRVTSQTTILSVIMTILLVELGVIFSFYPFSVWHSTLFIMSFLYIGLGLLHSHLRGRLFANTLTEYSLVAVFVSLVFLLLFPGK